MKRLLVSLFVVSLLTVVSTAHAGNALLSDLMASGAVIQKMSDEALAQERGTSYSVMQNGPMPSQLYGIKSHKVTYYGWGNQADTRYYRYQGYDLTPRPAYLQHQGNTYLVVGDRWFADMVSPVRSWNGAYARLFEEHFQVVGANSDGSLTISPFGLHRTNGWNRPLNKFRW